ncbi:MAG TPA: hypothetical protein DDY70_07135 [Clostridiales bacterium]|nr:hypothetical protein [Clostridiales bacterium]
MTDAYDTLPPCPYTAPDVYETIGTAGRPVVIYGMGNGAEKLLSRFEKRKIPVAGFFASDGFVRGQSFHGYPVRSYSETKAMYPDFLPVLAFASNREEVLTRFLTINGETPLLVPDLPVAGEEDFTPDFYRAHYEEIARAYDLFADEESRRTYSSVLWYKLTGRLEPLLLHTCTTAEIYKLLENKPIKCEIDVGAYRGDTVRESAEHLPLLKTVYAVEPDPKSYQKLTQTAKELTSPEVIPVHAAAGKENGETLIHGSGNRNSSLSGASYRHRDVTVPLLRIDSLTDRTVDYIKYDVEGAEADALIGSEGIIARDRPALLVSAYHRSRDLFALPLMLAAKYPFYRFYLRRTRCVPAWEIALIALPSEEAHANP